MLALSPLVIYGGPCSNCFVNSPHQYTPLHFAAGGGHKDTVRCLVGKGGDINNEDKAGVSHRVYTAECNKYC